MPDEKKRLEKVILEYIERITSAPSANSKEIEILPQMVHELIELWRS